MEQNYKYSDKFSKNAPGGDLFKLRAIFVPVNFPGTHWILAVLYMNKKRIVIYDSLGPRHHILHVCIQQRLLRYLGDEHQNKHNKLMPDLNHWRLDSIQPNTPCQNNSKASRY